MARTEIDEWSCGIVEQEVFHVGYIKHIDLWHISEDAQSDSVDQCSHGSVSEQLPGSTLPSAELLWCHGAGTSLASVATQSYWIIPNDAQFIQDGQGGKKNVAKKGNDPQFPVQLPSVDVNCYEEEDDGEKEGAGNENQSGAVHFHRVTGVHEGSLDKPGQTQAQHVKHIGAHNVGHGHVSFPW